MRNYLESLGPYNDIDLILFYAAVFIPIRRGVVRFDPGTLNSNLDGRGGQIAPKIQIIGGKNLKFPTYLVHKGKKFDPSNSAFSGRYTMGILKKVVEFENFLIFFI